MLAEPTGDFPEFEGIHRVGTAVYRAAVKELLGRQDPHFLTHGQPQEGKQKLRATTPRPVGRIEKAVEPQYAAFEAALESLFADIEGSVE